MTLPPFTILSRDDHRVTASFVLSADLEVFRGHFPEHSVLPGVAQIDWAISLATRCFALAEPVARDFQVKFSDVIRPEESLIVTLTFDRTAQRLTFEYRVGEHLKSSGRIKLEAAP